MCIRVCRVLVSQSVWIACYACGFCGAIESGGNFSRSGL